MVLMTYAMTSTASLLAMRLLSVVTKRKARQRKRSPFNQRQNNWSRRKKRNLQRAVLIALWGARSMQFVIPNDRPPPALTNPEHVSLGTKRLSWG
ncbi:hypothetical protein Bpfe_011884 [Biomphalaria pfeifferi]|uniref:Uncharacterized protein n=1 Tax=Biomphalaria pfeifferi TaxID=112525 RepID=A0AAD8FCX6_BIOPF|nr:hypothetical protein Bpfe_011884 [Biomphalaria pfeifferi]